MQHKNEIEIPVYDQNDNIVAYLKPVDTNEKYIFDEKTWSWNFKKI